MQRTTKFSLRMVTAIGVSWCSTVRRASICVTGVLMVADRNTVEVVVAAVVAQPVVVRRQLVAPQAREQGQRQEVALAREAQQPAPAEVRRKLFLQRRHSNSAYPTEL